ncbi:MAG: hypothetical protein HKN13_06715 [Rhodothermales bacterium]|nr:hypothetical protein [Rhodothermales bacterium]
MSARTKVPDTYQVRNRDELIFLLTEAAELEHMLCLQYLFAAFTLKVEESEGVTQEELIHMNDWVQTLLLVARQEMVHLGLANNLLTSIGGSPHFRRPNFPQPSKYFPFPMELRRFSEKTIKRFICYERPSWVDPAAAFCAPTSGQKKDAGGSDGISPRPVPYETVGELYGIIRKAFETMDEGLLFVGPPTAQVGGDTLHLNFPTAGMSGIYDMMVLPVLDRQTALRVIDEIVEEGEGTHYPHDVQEIVRQIDKDAPKDIEKYLKKKLVSEALFAEVEAVLATQAESHYARFKDVLADLQAMKKKRKGFDPARAVVANPVLYEHPDVNMAKATVITHPDTRDVLDVSNAAYETMMLLLARFYAHTDETDEELSALNYAVFYPMMTMVTRPLSEVLTDMPAFKEVTEERAGPSFEQFPSVHFLPHKESAWMVLHERLDQIADRCEELGRRKGVPDRMSYIGRNVKTLAIKFKHKLES